MAKPVKKVPLRAQIRAKDVVAAIVSAKDQAQLEHNLSLRKRLMAEYRNLAKDLELSPKDLEELRVLVALKRKAVRG